MMMTESELVELAKGVVAKMGRSYLVMMGKPKGECLASAERDGIIILRPRLAGETRKDIQKVVLHEIGHLEDDYWSRHPILYHLFYDGDWPSIVGGFLVGIGFSTGFPCLIVFGICTYTTHVVIRSRIENTAWQFSFSHINEIVQSAAA